MKERKQNLTIFTLDIMFNYPPNKIISLITNNDKEKE